MGNTASSSSTAPQQRIGRPTEPRYKLSEAGREKEASVGPRRRSLELPDFNRSLSSRGRQKTPPKSEAINIPRPPPDAPPVQRPHNNFSSTDLIIPATHLPFPPNQRTYSSASPHASGRRRRSRGRPQPMHSIYPEPVSDHRQQHEQLPLAPLSPTPFVKEIVKSTIPIGLCVDTAFRLDDEEEEEAGPALPAPVDDPALADYTPVKITWRGGGKVVILARAGDDDWNGRQPMEREHPNSDTWVSTVYLLPGTHHVRFLVDDQWRVSDEMSTAVDDQGSLANYVNVQPGTPPSQSSPLPPAAPQPPSSRQQPIPGQSFWSVGSSVDDDYRPQQDLATQVIQARWTNELPSELIEAAREEEAYLTASAGQYDAAARSVHVSGFVPAPSVPPAPRMPRHLDKLIMNTRMTIPSHSSTNSNTGSPSWQSANLPGGVGSGQVRSNGRERDRSKREGRQHRRREGRENGERGQQRERDRRGIEERQKRERESTRRDSGYPNLPPAPPPSEDGSGAGLDDKPEHSPVRGEEEVIESSRESANTTAITTPEAGPTPVDKEPAVVTSTAQQQTPKISARSPPPTPATKTTSIPTRPGPSPLTNESRAPVSGSRAITLDMENMPALTDDASVLPVPSHVVLQHLCTSAIKNGVVAVATTTRYRKKFMTTVYYKPT